MKAQFVFDPVPAIRDSLREKTIEETMRLFVAQAAMFAPHPSRLALLGLDLPTAAARRVTVNVWRNHGFEALEPLAVPYFSYRGWQAEFRLGGYDDTLMFTRWQQADAEILWLDSNRSLAQITFADWLQWLEGRLRTLRAVTTAPIILATWCQDGNGAQAIQDLVDSLPAVFFANLDAACAEAGVPLLDFRSAILAGTPLSNAAQVVLARKLACHWIPGTLMPAIKAVALDLDNTLHNGVLGEDGIQGVQLTPGHADLQRFIKSLQQQGIFIALVSRNELPDVRDLFAQRQDYPLRWEDFSAIEVSWGDKAAAIERIARSLRIAPDAVLFVDDNLGELTSVVMQLPMANSVYAHPDASLTRRVVQFYPGLWRWKLESDDAKRIQDLKAISERELMAESMTEPEEYFRSLQVAIKYRYGQKAQLNRLADLCNKTNQFNLALRRSNQAELAEHMACENACVASVQLEDRLSDSGIIAVIVAERHGTQLVVEELCVSCRAIGRQLEDSIILLTLRDMPIFSGCLEVVFRVQHGPRNKPALAWLASLLGSSEPPAQGGHALKASRLLDFTPATGITISKE